MSIQILIEVINPTLALLEADGIPATDRARAVLYAIGLQESILQHRRQLVGSPPKPTGPATGLWQFERGGGVVGVLNHRATSAIARKYAQERVGSIDSREVWAALERDDTLACIFARLLLWTDPLSLPEAVPATQGIAWDYYIRNWRPGKPHRQTWAGYWRQALEVLQ
jgi:hypothetical protein